MQSPPDVTLQHIQDMAYRIRRLSPDEVITRLRNTPLPAGPG